MRAQDIKIGEWYRLKSSPTYGYIKALIVIPSKSTVIGCERIHPEISKLSYITVKCLHSINMDDRFCLIKYFRPRDILQKG